jgi:hypothetical protein
MYTYSFMHSFMHACMHAYIHTYILHSFIHSYIHTYIQTTYIQTYTITVFGPTFPPLPPFNNTQTKQSAIHTPATHLHTHMLACTHTHSLRSSAGLQGSWASVRTFFWQSWPALAFCQFWRRNSGRTCTRSRTASSTLRMSSVPSALLCVPPWWAPGKGETRVCSRQVRVARAHATVTAAQE